MDLGRPLLVQHHPQATLLNVIGPDRETLSNMTVGWEAVSSGRLAGNKSKAVDTNEPPNAEPKPNIERETLQRIVRA